MEVIEGLFSHHPIITIVLLLLVISVIVSIIKGVLKLALTLGLVVVIAVLFFNVNPDILKQKGTEVGQAATTYYQNTLQPIINKEISGAKYTENKEDGSYVIQTSSLSLKGKEGEDKIQISYKDKVTNVDKDMLGEQYQKFIEEAKK